MHVPFLSNTKIGRGKFVVLVDVGSGSVAGGVEHMRHGRQSSQLIVTQRIALTEEERDAAQRRAGLIRNMEQVLQGVLKSYERGSGTSGYGALQDVHVIVHAPWVSSRSRTAEARLKQPTKITGRLITEVAQRAIEHTTQENMPQGMRQLEKSVIRVELNGYPVSQPEGKEAEHIRITVLESFIDEKLHRTIIDTLGRLLPGRKPDVRSSVFTTHFVLREMAREIEDYTVLDITGEASSLTTVRAGAVSEHGIIPIGSRLIVQQVAKKMGMQADEVLGIIKMMMDDACEKELCAKVSSALKEIEPSLVKTFGETFSSHSSGKRLPNVLVLSVRPELAPWAMNFFTKLDFSQFTVTGRPFAPQKFSAGAFTAYAAVGASASPDSGLSLAGAFVHIYSQNK